MAVQTRATPGVYASDRSSRLAQRHARRPPRSCRRGAGRTRGRRRVRTRRRSRRRSGVGGVLHGQGHSSLLEGPAQGAGADVRRGRAPVPRCGAASDGGDPGRTRHAARRPGTRRGGGRRHGSAHPARGQRPVARQDDRLDVAGTAAAPGAPALSTPAPAAAGRRDRALHDEQPRPVAEADPPRRRRPGPGRRAARAGSRRRAGRAPSRARGPARRRGATRPPAGLGSAQHHPPDERDPPCGSPAS